MSIEAYFPDPIRLRDGGLKEGSRIFILEHFFRYVSSWGVITVPTGFHTDGASVPRIFWPILGPHGDYFHAAIIHDFLYSKQADRWIMEREDADRLFLEAMFNGGVGWKRNIIYAAVRVGGWRSWKKR